MWHTLTKCPLGQISDGNWDRHDEEMIKSSIWEVGPKEKSSSWNMIKATLYLLRNYKGQLELCTRKQRALNADTRKDGMPKGHSHG